MAARNPLHRLAGLVPTPLDAVLEHGASAITDLAALPRVLDEGLPGDSLDDWDPELHPAHCCR